MESNLAESERDLVLRGQVDLPGDPDFVAQKREAVRILQKALQAAPSTLHTQQVTHHFAPGLYCREWRSTVIGEVTIGKRHRNHTTNVLAAGKCLVTNVADGRDRVVICAPHVWVSPPGTQRAIMTIEPFAWITVHPTALTDLQELEEALIDDHAMFLTEYGLTEQDAAAAMSVGWIKVAEPYTIASSPIHGVGVFARLAKGQRLTASQDGRKTEVGRFTNHSPFPNVRVIGAGSSLFFEAMTDIDGEVKVNYRHVIESGLRR